MCWMYLSGLHTSGRWNGSADICSRSRTRAPDPLAGAPFVRRAQADAVHQAKEVAPRTSKLFAFRLRCPETIDSRTITCYTDGSQTNKNIWCFVAAASADQGSVNALAVNVGVSPSPPTVKVGAGVFAWSSKLSGLDEYSAQYRDRGGMCFMQRVEIEVCLKVKQRQNRYVC